MRAMPNEPLYPHDPQLSAALAGQVPLRVGDVLRSAWRVVPGAKRWVLLGMLAWLGTAVFATIVGVALSLPEAIAASLSVIVTAPVTVALTMYGVRRVAGIATDREALLSYRPTIAHAVIVLLFASLVITVSEALLGPTLGTSVALLYGLLTGQAVFLVADRRVDAFTAIGWSVRASLPVLFTLLLIQLTIAGAVALGALALGIGLIWAAPFALLALGAVSYQLFGTRATPHDA